MIRNNLRLLVYLIAFAAVGAVAAYLLLQLAGVTGTVLVPSLTGKSISIAAGELENRGLSLEIIGESHHDDVPPDLIINQDVKEGEEVRRGLRIGVMISAGKGKFRVPYLEGMDLHDVRLTLEKQGMEIGKITRVHSDSVEKNRVITQRPLPGQYSDSMVNLVVSFGPYDVSYKCPSFINLTVKEARRMAQAIGLKLVEKQKGRVIVFQKPEAGSIIKKG